MSNYELNFGNVQIVAPLLKLARIVANENNDSAMIKHLYDGDIENDLPDSPEAIATENIENNLKTLVDEWNNFFDSEIYGHDNVFNHKATTVTATSKPTGFYHDPHRKTLANVATYLQHNHAIPENIHKHINKRVAESDNP